MSSQERPHTRRQRDCVSDRIVQRPAVVGQIEVLDAEATSILELVEPIDEVCEVDVAAFVGMHLNVADSRLAQLHVVGVCQQLGRVLTPARDGGSGANTTWTTPNPRRTRDILHYLRR